MTPERGVASGRGHLVVLLGAAPGVGKTFAMLSRGRQLAAERVDVVVAFAETHQRADTDALMEGLERIAPKVVTHRGATFEEMDTDAVTERHPQVVLVDELAHTNVPGGRYLKRWQDVEELLDAGIDVVTNLNVQHLESLNGPVEAITGVAQRETVPDAVVASADTVEFIDVEPEQLRRRLGSTDVVAPDLAAALKGYFSTEHLTRLRELALGWLAAHGLDGTADRSGEGLGAGSRPPTGRVVVALTGAPEGETVLRRAAHIAEATHAELVAVHTRTPSGSVEYEPGWLESQRRLLAELGGRYAEIVADDVASAVLAFADAEEADQLVLGATRRSRFQELLYGSVITRAIRHAGPVEIHVIPARRKAPGTPPPRGHPGGRPARVPLPLWRRQVAWALAVLAPSAVALALAPLHASIGLAGALFCVLVAVTGVAALGGIFPATLATIIGFLLADYFYTVPLHSLRVDRLIDLIALVAYVTVALIVSILVDVLARQGFRATRSRAVAENLARALADIIVVAPETLPDLPATVRRAFDLCAVAVLRPAGAGWVVDASAGGPVPQCPDDATHAVELLDHRTLALVASGPSALAIHEMDAFVAEVRLAEERYQLDRLRRPGGLPPRSGEDGTTDR